MAGQHVTGVLHACIAFHHRFRQVSHQGEQSDQRPQQQARQAMQRPAHQLAADQADQHGRYESPDRPFDGFPWGDR